MQIGKALLAIAMLAGAAHAQTVPIYVDQTWNNTVIPTCENGVCAGAAPEPFSISALVSVQYSGTTILNLVGENATTSGSGRVPRPGHAITMLATPALVTATPTLYAFRVFIDASSNAWTDAAYTVPLTRDVYGNPIDPSTATHNSDGSIATAGTVYASCPSCSNLTTSGFTMPCVTADGVVYALDCQSNPDPNVYYGPPITGWNPVCATPQTTNPGGSIVESYQQCAPTYSGGGTQVSHHDYQSPAYTAGAAARDVNNSPVTFACVNVQGTAGAYASCTWTGELTPGFYLMQGSGTSASGYNAGSAGGSTLGYPVTVPSANDTIFRNDFDGNGL